MTGPDPAETTPSVATPKTRTTRTAKAAVPDAASESIDPAVVKPIAQTAAVEAVAAAAPAPVAAAPAAPVVEPAPAPAPPALPVAPAPPAPAAAAPEIERPADTGPGAPGAPTPAPKRTTPDVAAAVDKAYEQLRTRLTMGEIVAGAGALIILFIAWFGFGIIFGHPGARPDSVVMVASAALLGILLAQNGGRHDFGPNYRVLVVGLCLAIGFVAMVALIQQLRSAFGSSGFDIGGITWWAGAIVAVIGGWMVWNEER